MGSASLTVGPRSPQVGDLRFPVSREFGTGEKFARDGVHHQLVLLFTSCRILVLPR